MASYGPYPPHSSFGQPPNQKAHPPPRPPPPSQQYTQNWSYGPGDGSNLNLPFSQNYNQMHQNLSYGYGPSSQQHFGASRPQHLQPPPTHLHHQQLPPQQQQQEYPYMPIPPPPESSYPPPPPPSMLPQAPMYYPSSQYSQFNHQTLQPPPPPPSPPPNSSFPLPPPFPSSPPPPSAVPPSWPNKDGGYNSDRGALKGLSTSGKHELDHIDQQDQPRKHDKPALPPVPMKKPNAPTGRVQMEEGKRLRKKLEMEKEKHRQEEKHRQKLKESQNTVLQKTQMLFSGTKGHGSILGSRMSDRRTAPLFSGERIENRLKKPTTFLCRMKFRNELPDPTAQPKLMVLPKDKDRYTKYTITSLEKLHKPELYVEPDLGIPLDLLDLGVYNRPKVPPSLAPEDEELLRDEEELTPVKRDGFRRKDRPTDKGVSWLVKTQYISPLSNDAAKQSLTEKQAKELRARKGNNILDNLNDRDRQIKEIEASFESMKSHPVHATNKNLQPVEIMPLFPYFEREDDQFVIATFDSSPTADSETYGKLDGSIRDACESKAIMKSLVARGSDLSKPERFLAYTVPAPSELSKDMFDESETISYSWIREYQWDVRGDDADGPTTYLVAFDDEAARYVPLPTKLALRKKRAKEGRSNEEVEHFLIPSEVMVKRRNTAAATELKDAEVYSNSNHGASNTKRTPYMEDGFGRPGKIGRESDLDQYSGAENEMSE